jgi:hypothetical protein
MHVLGQRRTRLGIAAAAVLPAFALAGCASEIDNSKAEGLVRQVATSAHATVKTVSCPSGITPKSGGSFDCKVTVTNPDGSEHSGTATVHMTGSDGGRIELAPADFHLQ